MNAFVRQLAVLSVLWGLCEMLLPEGKQQKMVRMAVSILVMTALIGTARALLPAGGDIPALNRQTHASVQDGYRRIALASAANQLRDMCGNLAKQAGYQAQAQVWLTQEGTIECVSLTLKQEHPLMDPQALCEAIARRLGTNPERILCSMEDPEAS